MQFTLFALAALSPLALAAPVPCEDHYPAGNATVAPVATGTAISTGTGLSTAVPTSSSNGSVSNVASASDGPIGYASMNGGTTGGAGGKEITVSDLDALTEAAESDGAAIIYVKGKITGSAKIRVASNKSILGIDSTSAIEGVGFYINKVSQVIMRNLAISKVLAENGDAIGIQKSTNVWIDHCDLSSDMDHDKDYYDGLLDVTHASDWVTLSNNYLHDHWKASLVGHSDSNGDEDTGYLHVTFANNHWDNLHSRGPSVRFGTAHIVNNYYGTMETAFDTRDDCQGLVESTVFTDVKKAVGSFNSDTTGYAVVKDVDFGISENAAPEGTLKTVPYEYTALGSANVKAAVVGVAGNTLTLG